MTIQGIVGNWKDLKSDYVSGKTPLAAIPAEDLKKIANILNTIMVRGLKLVKTVDGRNWQLISEPFEEVLGTKGLYKGVFLREYDEDGSLIAAGSETGTTVEDIDSGHQLLPTWDYPRSHS